MGPFLSGGLLHFIPLFVGLLFILIIVTFIFNMVLRAKEWLTNSSKPILTVPARVIAKRSEVKSYATPNHDDPIDQHTSTDYYATFEDEQGNRIELKISGRDYGLMADDDIGELTYQGTRFKGFKRRLRSHSF